MANVKDVCHGAPAGIAFLERSGAILPEEFPAIEQEAREEAKSRGFFGDCKGGAAQQCADIPDNLEQFRCSTKAEDRCYLERR